jgi:integrase
MIYDNNRKRIRECTRSTGELLNERIRELSARKPEWFIQYYVNGRLHCEKCPPEYQTKNGARRFEALRLSEIERGVYDDRDFRRATIAEIIDAYLAEVMVGRRGEASARCLGGHARRLIGNWRLDTIDRNPSLIVNHFRNFPMPEWSPKYRFNYFITVRAAINHWIRFRRLSLHNPCLLVRIDRGIRVMDYVPTDCDLEKILAASIKVGLPEWIRRLFIVVWETGLRIGEVMGLQVEDVVLHPDEGLPYLWVMVSKQKRAMRKPRPLSARCAAALAAQIAERTGGQVWPVNVPPYRLLRNSGLRKAAGWEHRWFHDSRKKAKLVFRAAAGREIAKEMLGHRTDAMDDYYTHYQRRDLEVAVAATYNADGRNNGQNKKATEDDVFDRP